MIYNISHIFYFKNTTIEFSSDEENNDILDFIDLTNMDDDDPGSVSDETDNVLPIRKTKRNTDQEITGLVRQKLLN